MAKAGETILVTEREDVVVELRPARRQPHMAASLDEALELLADSQQVTLRSAEGAWSGPRAIIRLSGYSSQEVLDQLREEGE